MYDSMHRHIDGRTKTIKNKLNFRSSFNFDRPVLNSNPSRIQEAPAPDFEIENGLIKY